MRNPSQAVLTNVSYNETRKMLQFQRGRTQEKVISMIFRLKSAFLVAAVGVVLIAPLAASAQTNQRVVSYSTTLSETDPQSQTGFFPGTLQFAVSSGGIVSGWYREAPQGNYVPVSGSCDLARCWFTLDNGNFQISATRQSDGTLAGSAITRGTVAELSAYPQDATSQIAQGAGYPMTFDFVARPIISG